MDKRDDELHKTVIRLIRENGAEKAPDGFTEMVLSRIGPVKTTSTTDKYHPLISRPVWLLIFVMTGILVAGSIEGWFPVDFISLTGIGLDRLKLGTLMPGNGILEASSALVYGVVALTVFAGLQIALVKRYLSARQQPA